jgi:hypothetical protein
VKKTVAGVGQGDGFDPNQATLEAQLGEFLETKYPELAKKRPTDVISNTGQAKGLRRFAGVGEIKSPYGRFNIDESGTIRKV